MEQAAYAKTGTGNSLVKITGLFKTEHGKGYEVRVNDEIVQKLAGIKPGSFLKIYENESKAGTTYLSLSVKELPPREG